MGPRRAERLLRAVLLGRVTSAREVARQRPGLATGEYALLLIRAAGTWAVAARAAAALRLLPGQAPRPARRRPSRRLLPGLLLGTHGDPHRGGRDEHRGYGRSRRSRADREDLDLGSWLRPAGRCRCAGTRGRNDLAPGACAGPAPCE